MGSSNTNDAIDTIFNTPLQRFQQAIKTSIEGSEFTNKSVGLLYYCFQEIDIRRAESYIMSPDWIVNKKAAINTKMKRIINALSGQ